MKDLREQIYFTDNEICRNKKRIESSIVTEKNKELILKFADFCAAAGASKYRILTSGTVAERSYTWK